MIELSLTTSNGAPTGIHKIVRMSSSDPFDVLVVEVNSYASEDAFLQNRGVVNGTIVSVPSTDLQGHLAEHVENWLVTDPASPFVGGLLVVDRSQSIETARSRTWNSVKVARDRALAGNFLYMGDLYQANKIDMTGATLGAMISKTFGKPYSQKWTLFDNTTRVLDADQTIGLGITLMTRVSAVHEAARTIRAQIDLTDSPGELAAMEFNTTFKQIMEQA